VPHLSTRPRPNPALPALTGEVCVSADRFNQSRARLLVVVPLTTRKRDLPIHVEVRPPDGGLREVSFAMCEQIRSLAVDRLGPHLLGSVPAPVLGAVEARVRLLLAL
jgi:mRNA interferase MazF